MERAGTLGAFGGLCFYYHSQTTVDFKISQFHELPGYTSPADAGTEIGSIWISDHVRECMSARITERQAWTIYEPSLTVTTVRLTTPIFKPQLTRMAWVGLHFSTGTGHGTLPRLLSSGEAMADLEEQRARVIPVPPT